jgi:SAM-dependent methyltransferase
MRWLTAATGPSSRAVPLARRMGLRVAERATDQPAPLAAPPPGAADEARLAYYYDLEHDALVADAALYCELARRCGGPVLELGCGTGRILAALVRTGYRVVGVDRSPAMLARAEARLRQTGAPAMHWRLVAADVRALALGERFSLVLAPLDFLGYFLTLEDQLAVLTAVRAHLAPDGRFVVDVVFPAGAFLDQPEGVLVHQWTQRTDTGEVITKWWVRQLDPVRQLQHLTAFYDHVASDGVLRRRVQELTLRYYHRYELEFLLDRAGFVVEGVYGDYALDALRPDSTRLLVLARAAARPERRRRQRVIG